jgi:hypothetical protein
MTSSSSSSWSAAAADTAQVRLAYARMQVLAVQFFCKFAAASRARGRPPASLSTPSIQRSVCCISSWRAHPYKNLGLRLRCRHTDAGELRADAQRFRAVRLRGDGLRVALAARWERHCCTAGDKAKCIAQRSCRESTCDAACRAHSKRAAAAVPALSATVLQRLFVLHDASVQAVSAWLSSTYLWKAFFGG